MARLLPVYLLLSVVSCACVAPAAEEPVFYAGFDGSAVALGPGGVQISPLQGENLPYAPGMRGQAFRAEGATLVYPASVVPADRGSLEIWIAPLPEALGGGWYFFSGDATQWGPDGVPRLWMYEGAPRFDEDSGGRLISASLPSGVNWQEGTWHQFVGTWDRAGNVALYVDGRLVARKSVAPWAAPSREGFRIGSGIAIEGGGVLPAHALVDEVRIYDRILSAEEVRSRFLAAGIPQLAVRLDGGLLSRPPEQLPILVENVGGGAWRGKLSWKAGEQSGELELSLEPGEAETALVQAIAAADAVGEMALQVWWREGLGAGVARSEQLALYVPPPLPPPSTDASDWRPVRSVRCAEEAPVTEVGTSSPAEGPAGRYREAGGNCYDRFAYCFKLSGSGRLLRLTVEHPDDKKRCTMLSYSIPRFQPVGIAGSEQQVLGHGILSGGLQSLSGQMIRRQYVFPCESDEVAIIVETGTTGQPAAAATLELEEADGRYGPAGAAPALGATTHRRCGLYWEDPVLSQTFGWAGTDYAPWDAALGRAMDYLAWTGQDFLVYPTVWYHGPIYQSAVEQGTWPSGGRYHPAQYPRLIALRCAQRGVTFVPTYTIWRLPSLAEWVRTPEEVIAGVPSVNTVTSDGRVLTDTNWGSPPLLNAQHPRVQQALLDLLDEHVAMCGDVESFGGVGFALWPSSPMQAGANLLTSYDDFSVEQFATSIGATPPGEPTSAERFRQRAQWILGDPERKAAWVRRRCESMTRFYREAAEHLAAAGPNAKLRLMIQQPYPERGGDPAQQLLEQGIDLRALSADPRIVLDRWLNQTAHRSCEKDGYDPASIYYDQAELSTGFQLPFRDLPNPSATIHQQYFESHAVLGNPQAPKLQFPAPWEVEAYGRACQPTPWGRGFLRHHARSLLLFDAQWIAIGGFSLGTMGAEAEAAGFCRAFRALPRAPFEDLGCTGAVMVRTATAEGQRWAYAVNFTDRAADLALAVTGDGLRDAATGEPTGEDGALKVSLRPYELRVWRMDEAGSLALAQRNLPPEPEAWEER